jgi:phospholipid transport system substrate-binding protein
MRRLLPTRRTLLRLTALASPALVAPSLVRAETDTAQAAAFIKQTGQEMATLIGGAPTAAEKRRRLQPFIDRVVDVDGVARFCLGRHWRQATPAQQETYVRLFHGVLLNNVVGRMGDYQHTAMHVIIGQPEAREDGIHVPTILERTGHPPARVTWVVRLDGTPRIVDVMAERTSLRLTMRSDYNAFLARHGNSIDALIDALREQTGQTAAG